MRGRGARRRRWEGDGRWRQERELGGGAGRGTAAGEEGGKGVASTVKRGAATRRAAGVGEVEESREISPTSHSSRRSDSASALATGPAWIFLYMFSM